MSEYVWEPVEHGYILRGDGVSLAVFDNVLGYSPKLWLSGANFRETLDLPDDLRLCRRVPASALDVPLSFAARELLRCLLNDAFRDGYLDPDNIEPSTEELIRLVDQPAPGERAEK